ncbi:MAG TPA: glutamate-cysteine ligase family protein [Rubrobacteraceae bacterium]|nr:glutamate-cysteine ligase family protein [Rubrobacteraceae bacterium]
MKGRASTVDEALEDISRRFAAGFPAKAPSLRTVGREAEFPVVMPDGRAADVFLLWPLFLEAGGCEPIYDRRADGSELLVGVEAETWNCVIEVGRATVELSVGPQPTLHELARDMEQAQGRLEDVVRRAGFRLLGYGIQPRTPASPHLLTPKTRYLALLEAIGPQWLKFCVTAADQVQVDMGRDDLVTNMNLINAAAGAIIALTANSPVYGGRAGRFASGREGLTANMVGEPYRHGASPKPHADLEAYVRFLADLRCLCLPDGDGGFEGVGGSFANYLGREPSLEPEALYEEFLFHEHYVWPSARPRARIGTLEIRPACQQPPGSAWVPSALALGLVEAADELASFFESELGGDSWDALVGYRERAVRHGLGAREPMPGFLGTLLDLADRGLRKRGRGEEAFLAPAFERLERGSEPASQARAAFERDGAEGLLTEVSLS